MRSQAVQILCSGRSPSLLSETLVTRGGTLPTMLLPRSLVPMVAIGPPVSVRIGRT